MFQSRPEFACNFGGRTKLAHAKNHSCNLELLLHCNTKSSLGRIDLPNPKKLLGMLADIALTQVYSVTATTTTVVTGEEKNTEK